MQLENKLVVVTGAGRGIGRAMALAFAQKRSDVALLDLNQTDLDRTRELCEAESVRCRTYLCNVTREEDVSNTLDGVVRDFGRLDVMINNAGITKDALLVKVQDGKVVGKMSLDQWRAVIDVNLTGTFLTCRAVAPGMEKRGYGRIVNIASIAGKEGNPNACAYSASKAGVISLTKSLGKELATTGVRVNCIAPAVIETEMLEQSTREHIAYMVSKIPMGRLGQVDEVAALVCWLASEECSFSTGAVFDISGGRATY